MGDICNSRYFGQSRQYPESPIACSPPPFNYSQSPTVYESTREGVRYSGYPWPNPNGRFAVTGGVSWSYGDGPVDVGAGRRVRVVGGPVVVIRPTAARRRGELPVLGEDGLDQAGAGLVGGEHGDLGEHGGVSDRGVLRRGSCRGGTSLHGRRSPGRSTSGGRYTNGRGGLPLADDAAEEPGSVLEFDERVGVFGDRRAG